MALMTGRERILSALRGEEVDRIPWVPLIVPYTIAGLSQSVPHMVVETLDYFGCDIFPRGSGDIFAVQLPKSDSRITPFLKYVDGDQVTGYITPEGTIAARWRSIGYGAMTGPVEYLIKTIDDLKAYRYFLQNMVYYYADLSDHFEFEQSIVGDKGVLCDAGIGFTPIQYFLEMLCGVENTYYLMSDAPELFDEVMDMMHQNNKAMLAHIARNSKAEVFSHQENTSSTTMSPAIFERYCLSQLNEYSKIFHNEGKLHVIHMCGKLKKLSHLIAKCECDAITDIAPAPAGDTELWEAKALFGGKLVTGGIGTDTFINSTPEQCYESGAEILKKLKGSRGISLGSGDSVPYGTSAENLFAFRQAVLDFGCY